MTLHPSQPQNKTLFHLRQMPLWEGKPQQKSKKQVYLFILPRTTLLTSNHLELVRDSEQNDVELGEVREDAEGMHMLVFLPIYGELII